MPANARPTSLVFFGASPAAPGGGRGRGRGCVERRVFPETPWEQKRREVSPQVAPARALAEVHPEALVDIDDVEVLDADEVGKEHEQLVERVVMMPVDGGEFHMVQALVVIVGGRPGDVIDRQKVNDGMPPGASTR